MERKVVIGVLALVFFAQIVSAATTYINVKTMPDHEMQMTVIDVSSGQVIEGFRKISDRYGDTRFKVNIAKPTFDLILCLKTVIGESVLGPEKFLEGYKSGDEIFIEYAPSYFEFIETPEGGIDLEVNVTESANETEPEINKSAQIENSEGGSGLTSYAILGADGVLKYKYYLIGFVGFVVLGFLGFKARKFVKIERPQKEIRVKKLSEVQKEKEETIKKSRDLEEAEKRLKEAQAEVNSLKNKDKIADLKRKIVEEQQALMKLRGGEEDSG